MKPRPLLLRPRRFLSGTWVMATENYSKQMPYLQQSCLPIKNVKMGRKMASHFFFFFQLPKCLSVSFQKQLRVCVANSLRLFSLFKWTENRMRLRGPIQSTQHRSWGVFYLQIVNINFFLLEIIFLLFHSYLQLQ